MAMRCNLILVAFFVSATVLLLAKSDGVTAQRVEVRVSNSQIDIVGADVDQVTPAAASQVTIRNMNGRAVVEAEKQGPISLIVPRRSSLDIATSNGAIHVSGVSGTMQLITSNGAIRVH